MYRSSFDALGPVCPGCRLREGVDSPLFVAMEEDADSTRIVAGILQCGRCGGEYPILDGMPVLVPDVRRFVEDNLFYLMARTDLTPAVESLLGDASGASSGLQSIRQHVSSYVWDHWADFDPEETEPAPGVARPGSVARLLEQGLGLVGETGPGPAIDIGCGPGRVAAELATRTGRLVVAADLSVPLARAACQAISGTVDYPRRRVGMVFDRRRFNVATPGSDRVEVWLCDALHLPFAEGTFALATAMNVLDCVAEPRTALVEMSRVLRVGAEAIVALPFDWSDRVTTPAQWLGGHSQRGPHAGRAEDVLRSLIDDGDMAIGTLRATSQPVEASWHVRLHDRSCMHYTCQMVAVRRVSTDSAGPTAEVN